MGVRIERNAEPIPGYRLIERLGGGGFGEVWKVEAPGGFLKAIKFVYGELDTIGADAQRAEQELKAIRRVQSVRHPYILSLERFDIIDGQLLIVMELADRNLWDRFKECRSQNLTGIPRAELLRYLAEAAEALDLMNTTYGLQHLDIKPQNLFLVHNHIKVADFGLVKDLEGWQASVTGGVTPVYAAPETFDGWVSRFSDQYSLAIVYEELITGQRPFSGTNVCQLVLQHMQDQPNLSSLLPGDQPVLARALAKKPEARFPTCQALIEALQAASPPLLPAGESIHGAASLASCPDLPGEAIGAEPARQGLGSPPGPVPAEPPLPSLGAAANKLDLGNAPRGLYPLVGKPKDGAPVPEGVSQRPTTWIGMPQDDAPEPAPDSWPVFSFPARGSSGILFPALVVGLGRTGLAVLQRLRSLQWARLGSADACSLVRFLYLDTDPEALQTARNTAPTSCLTSSEILLARLKRPYHYLKPRNDWPEVKSWLDPQMVYRIPRTYLTGGCRALGRLAFCDNYRLIVQRLQSELEACANPENVQSAARKSTLGLRSLGPRVYVIAGLGGGSGGGMFLDLAYVARDLLRRQGHSDPDLVGLFLLPSLQQGPAHHLALGNAFAALAELNHFAGGAEFSARYLERGGAIRDPAPPFHRCFLLPLDDEEKAEGAKHLGQLAEYLANDLWTFLGQVGDQARASLSSKAPAAMGGTSCHTFGLFRFLFPRRELVAQTARGLCQKLVLDWLKKDASSVRERALAQVQEKWSRPEYGPEALIERLQAECGRVLGEAPETLFGRLLAPMSDSALPEAATVHEALNRLEEYVGWPVKESLSDHPGRIQEAMQKGGEGVVAAWGQQLANLVDQMVETPGLRLAGAEEAIRTLIAGLQNMLEHQDPLARDLSRRAVEAFDHAHYLLACLQRPGSVKPSKLPKGPEVHQVFSQLAKYRYQESVIRQVLQTLVSLRGVLSDKLGEINFYRTRLHELARTFGDRNLSGRGTNTAPGGGFGFEVPGCLLFPSGCSTLEEAIGRATQEISAEKMAQLDTRIQELIRKQFHSLACVCGNSANVLGFLENTMQQEAEACVDENLSGANAAELFLQKYPTEEESQQVMSLAFAGAVPDLVSADPQVGRPGPQSKEFYILVVPEGPAGEKVRELAMKALPQVKFWHVTEGEEILFYRETALVALQQVPHLGPLGLEAYQQLAAIEHYTPHAREDIAFHGV